MGSSREKSAPRAKSKAVLRHRAGAAPHITSNENQPRNKPPTSYKMIGCVDCSGQWSSKTSSSSLTECSNSQRPRCRASTHGIHAFCAQVLIVIVVDRRCLSFSLSSMHHVSAGEACFLSDSLFFSDQSFKSVIRRWGSPEWGSTPVPIKKNRAPLKGPPGVH